MKKVLDKITENMIGTAESGLFFHKIENSYQNNNELLQQSIGTEMISNSINIGTGRDGAASMCGT